MPYIKQEDRDKLETIEYITPKTAGELNYLFTKLIYNYIDKKGCNYQHFNDALGALEGCKLELYRRFIGRYENEKIIANGDVRPKKEWLHGP